MDAQLTWTLWTVAHTLFNPVAEIVGTAVDVEPSLAITFVLEHSLGDFHGLHIHILICNNLAARAQCQPLRNALLS